MAGVGALAVIRRSGPGDEEDVLRLLERALGWGRDDPLAAFFAWKHRQSPFGPSPGWVAVVDDEVIGFRTFLRWEYTSAESIVPAVRAVDTATHPDHQGRGVFSRLTLQAIDELTAEGVAFVFNTPNRQSQPGYQKMGWQIVGRLPLLMRPRSPLSLLRVARARQPAQKWSMPTTAGYDANEALADTRSVRSLLDAMPVPSGLVTHRTPEYLTWRYGFAPLHYRALPVGRSIEDGMVIFRVRRRGSAVEATICELLVPEAADGLVNAAIRKVLRDSSADYVVRLDLHGGSRRGWLPLPRQGPTLTWRPLSAAAAPDEWSLSLGDIELF